MAIKEKDLVTQWMPQIRWSNGANVNLAAIRERIQEEADENGIPVDFKEESIKVGGLFSSEHEDILIMFNPQHANDYLRFAIRVQHQGKYAFMQVYNLGGSKNFGNDNRANWDSNSGGLGIAIGIAQSIKNSLGGHKAKIEAEENYYTILRDCLENVVD